MHHCVGLSRVAFKSLNNTYVYNFGDLKLHCLEESEITEECFGLWQFKKYL